MMCLVIVVCLRRCDTQKMGKMVRTCTLGMNKKPPQLLETCIQEHKQYQERFSLDVFHCTPGMLNERVLYLQLCQV